MHNVRKCRRELVTGCVVSKLFIVLGAPLVCIVLQCTKDLQAIRDSKSLAKASKSQYIKITEHSLEFLFTLLCFHIDYKFYAMHTDYSYMHCMDAICISTLRPPQTRVQDPRPQLLGKRLVLVLVSTMLRTPFLTV